MSSKNKNRIEHLKMAQYFRNYSKLKEKKRSELLMEVDPNYCIPDTLPGKEQKRVWAGYTSLHFAVMNCDLELTKKLLNQGADVVKLDTVYGCTPLHLATNLISSDATSDRLQASNLVDILLSKQIEVNNIRNPESINGISHFHIAVIRDHPEAVHFFAKNIEPQEQSIDSDGDTPLHFAIEHLCVEAAGTLLQLGADVHFKNKKGMSCVHLLMKCTMDINDFRTIGKRTLSIRLEDEMDELESIAETMLKNREIFVDDIGLSALHLACTLGDKSIAKDLLKKGAQVNRPVNSGSKFWPGWTPIHFAACSNIQMMLLLMESGANIMMKNLKGETALDLCARHFTSADIELILSMEDEFKNILLSDQCTKLLDLLLAMNDYVKFSAFFKKLEKANILIPWDSPIWSGYNLLHLSVSLNERTKLKQFPQDLEISEDSKAIQRYNCTEDEEALFYRRIELCLEYGCSVDTKNTNGQTPIHLAFSTSKRSALEKMLSCSEEDVVDHDGLSHLHIACILGLVDTVTRFLGTETEVNIRTKISFDWQVQDLIRVRVNSTPLHVAVLFGHKDVVECLLKNNADVYAQDSLGLTPIHLLMSLDWYVSKDLADLLFKATPNLRDSVSTLRLSHLHVAAYFNKLQAVDELLLAGTEVDRVIDANVKEPPYDAHFAGKTALFLTTSNPVIESLLKAGANVYVKDPSGMSALQHFLRDMKAEIAEPFTELVKKGECEVESFDGMTALHVACGTGDLEWAEQLLQNGADVNARMRDDREKTLSGGTPLHTFLDQADNWDYDNQEIIDFVKLLVDSGADPNLTMECSGSTSLHLIYEHYYCSNLFDDENSFYLLAVDVMLKSLKSYDVNPINYLGFSHFHFACGRNDVETVTKFLDHGVDVNESMDPFERDSYGFTALHFAMASRCREVAYLLLDRGADVNAEDVHGNTPLHAALKYKFVDLALIETMISHGGDIRAKNLSDETPLYYLLKFGNLTIDDYLIAFELFMDNGYDLDEVDKKGTPMKEAVSFFNLEAVNTLLKLGADVNMIDIGNEFPADEIIVGPNTYSEREVEIAKTLATHAWKMRFTKLNLKDSNLRFLEKVEGHFSLVSLLEQPCQDELSKARGTEICQGLTVKDFLSELGGFAEYPRMSTVRQSIVDNFFNSKVEIRREFPEFCGILAYLCKKVLPRMKLWQPAKEAIILVCNVPFPDLCLEAILRYFTNIEMKLLIEVVEELI